MLTQTKQRKQRRIDNDFIGEKFGKLTIIARAEKHKTRNTYYFICQCDCGNVCKKLRQDMVSGNTTSCGCMSSRNVAGDRTRTHNMRHTRQYNIWTMLKARCNNPNSRSYKDYGGRGIAVEWKSFEEFWEDMKDSYADNLTIERIDYNKNYCKENCTWIPRSEQNKNRRGNVMVTFNGETLPLGTMAKKYGYNRSTIDLRLKSGMTIEESLTKPIKK
jgi:hypothetical protein